MWLNYLRRFQRTLLPIGAVANSVYLSILYIRGFFSEAGTSPLIAEFMTPFFTVPIILLSLWLISNIRKKTYLPDTGHLGVFFFLTVPFYLLAAVFLAVFTFILWKQVADNAAASVKLTLSLLAEIIAIALAVGAEKTRRLAAVLKLLFLWGYSLLGAMCVLGIFEKLHSVEIPNDLGLVFSGIFFHACNSTYLLYAGIRRASSSASRTRQRQRQAHLRQSPTAQKVRQ